MRRPAGKRELPRTQAGLSCSSAHPLPGPRASLQGMARDRSAPRGGGGGAGRPILYFKEVPLAQKQTRRKATSGLGNRVITLFHEDRYSASGSLQISKFRRNVSVPGEPLGCSHGGIQKPTVLTQEFSGNMRRESDIPSSRKCFDGRAVLPRPYLFNLSHRKENLNLLCSYLTIRSTTCGHSSRLTRS